MEATAHTTNSGATLSGVVDRIAIGLGDRMSKKAACEYLGVCARTLERYSEIPKLRWKGRVWYSRSALDAFLAAREGVAS